MFSQATDGASSSELGWGRVGGSAPASAAAPAAPAAPARAAAAPTVPDVEARRLQELVD